MEKTYHRQNTKPIKAKALWESLKTSVFKVNATAFTDHLDDAMFGALQFQGSKLGALLKILKF